ncbi:hypothetical protein ACIA5D_48015 [Actinoplanes sp. NPDC051513]|uniref:hypothetical protein n=1 Tax=Actinoplanes sp. NPDC051513 TaxID=3363908 RepID=UPI0037901E78
MTATVDGLQAIEARLTDGSLTAGHVVLGATNNSYTGESKAGFANIAIYEAKRQPPESVRPS